MKELKKCMRTVPGAGGGHALTLPVLLSQHRLVQLELFEEVKVGALAVHVLLDDAFHALFLQRVCHVVERVLVRDRDQHLETHNTVDGRWREMRI